MENTCFKQGSESPRDGLFGIASIFLIVATIFLGLLFVKELGSKDTDSLANISVSGTGEVYSVPDIAVITFSIREEAKTSKDAASKMADKEKKAIDFLKSKDIDEKDIKTEWFNTYPKYEYVRSSSICTPEWCPPSSGKQTVVGYEANQTIRVKVRNIDIAGEIISGLTEVGINEVNGPEFSVDDPDALQAEARRMAIEDAKEKAEVLRKDLGVKLVRIISYYEGGDYPTYYGMGGDAMMTQEAKVQVSNPVKLSAGEQKVVSNITIVYEIR